MAYYLGVLILVMAVAFYTRNHGPLVMLIPAFVILVAFAGARSRWVGTDSNFYARVFESPNYSVAGEVKKEADSITFLPSPFKYALAEPAFPVLNGGMRLFSHRYPALFFGVALICVTCYLASFYRFSEDVELSVFLFITLGFYLAFFNGARQGIAAAIYTLSFGSLIERRFFRYCFWVCLAALFHRTVLIGIPLYFLFVRRNSLALNCVLVVLACFATKLLGPMTQIAAETVSERYATYVENANSGGELFAGFFTTLALVLLLLKVSIQEDDRLAYDVWLNMALFGAVIYVTVMAAGLEQNSHRLANYFTVSLCYAMPLLFKNLRVVGFTRLSGDFCLRIYMSLSVLYYYLMIPKKGFYFYRFNEWIAGFLGLP